MMKSAKGGKRGSGGLVKTDSGQAMRPPKVKGRVANDLYQSAPRSAVMPPPTKDTKVKRGR